MRRIYAASSWRNPHYPAIVKALRAERHDVYDFRNPPKRTGFAWEECGVGEVRTIPEYLQAIGTTRAREGFWSDKNALDWCDTCVLILPCGRSAHLEAGYAKGRGKEVFVLLHEDKFEPELMYLLCDGIYHEIDPLLAELRHPMIAAR